MIIKIPINFSRSEEILIYLLVFYYKGQKGNNKI